MKRTIVWLLALVMVTLVQAEEITSQQALQQAQRFLQERATAKNRAQKATPQLTMAKQVSGLYVFNMADNQGFVIVSNDDGVLPILGFSDSGHLDPDNMPTNMRAWLQGYADEIAWAKEHIAEGTTAQKTSAMRRAGTHSTVAIEPLMTTKWNQGKPYNNQVPYASYGFVTGCVATAMAQAMCYTERKAGNSTTTTTAEIPSYTTKSYGLSLEAIPSGTTLDWSNMIDDYENGYTANQASAVANLMKCCGYSVEMDYGYSSGTQTAKVATALKSYFGYANTTQYLCRSFYSYSDWTDLIYNELSQGRPVVYGGQSEDNGHCFVCDGYKYEEGDQFHINWGWGGGSDGYFVLSVLNPDEQGIGGSATNSAYNSGQEAVVGIQKIGGTGTVLDVSSHTPDLTLISASVPYTSIALGEHVDVTVKVRNNSEYVYDGEICLSVNGGLGISKMFEIPAGATQDCVITFTPTSVGSYTLGADFPNPTGEGNYVGINNLGASLTVVNQTPTDLVATNVTSNSATVDWTNVGEASKWNIRKKNVVLTEENFNGSVSGWQTIDWNSDGTVWILSASAGIDGTPCYVSPSYNGSDLAPDDGLVTPQFELGGTFSFYAKGNDEHFMVYLSTNGYNFSSISNEIVTTNTWTKYEFDLSDYAGQKGWIVIDHFNSAGHTSTSYLCIDNVTFITSTGEWTVEEVTTKPHLLKGLTKQTCYQVQVQPVISNGGNWSDTLTFTTTEAAVLTGDVNNDGGVTITDAVGIVNYILGNPAAGFNEDAADVNGDGEITITDAVGVVNIILKGE